MQVFYVGDDLPNLGRTEGIFLAGPTPRSPDVQTWRKEALQILEDLDYEGAVYIPETVDWNWLGDYNGQVTWEWRALAQSKVTLFWMPRDLKDMPAFTTNVEFGFIAAFRPMDLVLGYPEGAPKNRYLASICEQAQYFHLLFKSSACRPGYKIPRASSLRETLTAAVGKANARD